MIFRIINARTREVFHDIGPFYSHTEAYNHLARAEVQRALPSGVWVIGCVIDRSAERSDGGSWAPARNRPED